MVSFRLTPSTQTCTPTEHMCHLCVHTHHMFTECHVGQGAVGPAVVQVRWKMQRPSISPGRAHWQLLAGHLLWPPCWTGPQVSAMGKSKRRLTSNRVREPGGGVQGKWHSET